MTKMQTNSDYSKSKTQVLFEYISLTLCLCVIAIRITLTEGPVTSTSFLPANLWDNVYSLTISTGLFFGFLFWFIGNLATRKFAYRSTGIEIGLCIFCIAAVIACFAASDKRLAITSFATFLAPVIMAILLVQILDSDSKIKLLLCVIVASAVVSAYQSTEQFFSSNQMTIEKYEENPQAILEPLGIEQNTFQHFLFEHRLYSRGIRGFFTTRNSAGTFLLMASFAALVLSIERFKNRKSDISGKSNLYRCGAVIMFILFALVLTKSKGAILGFLFAAALFVMFLLFGTRLKALNKIILIACLLIFIASGCFVVWYGMTHDRMPGGNSMLVRWQYWNASAKMYTENPLTGVGPGNFKIFYPHYKPAGALESVADPHNFPLSILTQYGPLGLVGFLMMIFAPLWKINPSSGNQNQESKIERESFKTLTVTFLIIISAAMLLIRPLFMRASPKNAVEVLYMIFNLYIAPIAAFIIGFWLLVAESETAAISYRLKDKYISYALFCAVSGVMLHNLIDFAIFEPPVFTAFWALIACLIATDARQNKRKLYVLKTAPAVNVLMGIIILTANCVFYAYVLAPVVKSTVANREVQRAISNGQTELTHILLTDSAEYDQLDPTALNMNGCLYLQHYFETNGKQPKLLEKAKKLSQTDDAIAHYKKAIEIEDSFRKQFKTMYPEWETISRLGEDKYQLAIKNLKKLSNPDS